MQTEAVRRALVARLAALGVREEKIAVHLHHEDGRRDADFEDVAPYVANDEVLEGLDAAARAEVVDVRAALRRLDDGTYGLCADCGDAIEAGRLASLPQARMCTDCAYGAERARG